MPQQQIELSAPTVIRDTAVLFSAYGFGWGYRAFSLPTLVVREQLGASNPTVEQLSLAFELGKRRIMRAVEETTSASFGERITLRSLAPDDRYPAVVEGYIA